MQQHAPTALPVDLGRIATIVLQVTFAARQIRRRRALNVLQENFKRLKAKRSACRACQAPTKKLSTTRPAAYARRVILLTRPSSRRATLVPRDRVRTNNQALRRVQIVQQEDTGTTVLSAR